MKPFPANFSQQYLGNLVMIKYLGAGLFLSISCQDINVLFHVVSQGVFMPTDPNVMRALNLFNKGFNCSQSILAAFANDFGMDEVQALKLATGLGGGMGCTARTCGAVTGAFLVIGLKYGSHKAEDKDSKAKTYAKVREFIEEFEKKRGSIECKQLVGIDISSETGFAEARDKKLFKTICPEVVEEAEAILRRCL